jgi:hypothetical protein
MTSASAPIGLITDALKASSAPANGEIAATGGRPARAPTIGPVRVAWPDGGAGTSAVRMSDRAWTKVASSHPAAVVTDAMTTPPITTTAKPRRKAWKINGWRLAEEVRGFGLLTRGEGFVADVMKRVTRYRESPFEDGRAWLNSRKRRHRAPFRYRRRAAVGRTIAPMESNACGDRRRTESPAPRTARPRRTGWPSAGTIDCLIRAAMSRALRAPPTTTHLELDRRRLNRDARQARALQSKWIRPSPSCRDQV